MDLFDKFIGTRFDVDIWGKSHETECKKIPQNKRIILMEDCDCDSYNFLLKRELQKNKKKKHYQNLDDSDSDDDMVSVKKKKSNMMESNYMMGNYMGKYMSKYMITTSGYLNCVDGLCELDGGMIVLTTNSIKDLDPAVTRPGRVDIMIHMDYIKQPELLEMLEYYYDDIDDIGEYEDKIPNVNNSQLSPAKIEQLIMNNPDIDDFIEKLKEAVVDQQPNDN